MEINLEFIKLQNVFKKSKKCILFQKNQYNIVRSQ